MGAVTRERGCLPIQVAALRADVTGEPRPRIRGGNVSSGRRSASSSRVLHRAHRLRGSRVQSRERRRASSLAQASMPSLSRTIVRSFARRISTRCGGVGQEDAPLVVRLLDEVAVTASTLGNRRVVASDAQPSPQPYQHLVAEEAQVVRRRGPGNRCERNSGRCSRARGTR